MLECRSKSSQSVAQSCAQSLELKWRTKSGFFSWYWPLRVLRGNVGWCWKLFLYLSYWVMVVLWLVHSQCWGVSRLAWVTSEKIPWQGGRQWGTATVFTQSSPGPSQVATSTGQLSGKISFSCKVRLCCDSQRSECDHVNWRLIKIQTSACWSVLRWKGRQWQERRRSSRYFLVWQPCSVSFSWHLLVVSERERKDGVTATSFTADRAKWWLPYSFNGAEWGNISSWDLQ